MPIRPSIVRPSFSSGYAAHAGESANPGLWTGLRALWAPSLGPTGTRLVDVSGRRNHLTNTNAPTWAGRDSLLFDDASSQYAIRTGTCGITDYPYSFSVWCKPDAFVNQTAIGFGRTASDDYHRILFRDPGDNDILFQSVRSGSTVSNLFATGTYSLDEWVHVVAVGAADQDHRLYVDGGNKVTDITNSVDFGFVDNTTIGAAAIVSSVVHFWSGEIRSAAVWNRSLTDSEAAELYADPDALVRKRSRVLSAPAAAPATIVVLRRRRECA